MAYFSLFGDHFNPDEVTSKLNINPTRTAIKGDAINELHSRKETSWTLSTEYEESLDINDQLKIVVNLLKDKVDALISLQMNHKLNSKFFIVVVIEDGQAPALYFDSDFIKFAGLINAEIDIDLYANPYKSEWDEE